MGYGEMTFSPALDLDTVETPGGKERGRLEDEHPELHLSHQGRSAAW